MNDINEKNQKIKNFIKKGATFSLCAVLAGGLAAGGFEGINYLTGWNGTQQEVSAAVNKNDGLTLMKSTSDSKSAGKGNLDVSDIVKEAMPSVVSITTKSIQEIQNYYGMFGYGGYAPQKQEVQGSGSGIILGKNDDMLFIATNYHVVQDAETLSVCFVDGEAYEGTVRGFDEGKDLAVVSVALDDISDDTMDQIDVATIGSSDDLEVGEQVVAIGNALGYGQSVTTGIVSAKNRRLDSSSGAVKSGEDNRKGVNLIQTDAAINPGNSGGALLNMNGEVIGINSAKLASTEVEGMGYAIAISDVSDILEQMMNEEPREKLDDNDHGILGITGSTVSNEGISVYGIPEGVFVSEVTKGGPADEAGIKKNYVITEFDGRSVASIQELVERLGYYEPDEKVEVTVQIPDGNGYKEKTVTVTLGENTNKSKSSKDDAKDKDTREDDSEYEDSQENDRDSIIRDWADEMEQGGYTFQQQW